MRRARLVSPVGSHLDSRSSQLALSKHSGSESSADVGEDLGIVEVSGGGDDRLGEGGRVRGPEDAGAAVREGMLAKARV